MRKIEHAPNVPPIIAKMGLENAKLNGRFPQQGFRFHALGTAAVMFT